MDKKKFVVVRRYGYYINVIPNDPEAIERWQRSSIPFVNPNMNAGNNRFLPLDEAIARGGYTFSTVPERCLPDIKPYVRPTLRKY